VAIAFVPNIPMRDAPELVIDQGYQSIECGLVSRTPFDKQPRQVIGRHRFHRSKNSSIIRVEKIFSNGEHFRRFFSLAARSMNSFTACFSLLI
jgi:hypothetical protein